MKKLSELVKGVAFTSPRLTRMLRQCRLLLHYFRASPHEADFHFLSASMFKNGLLLDLGANIGQSAVSAIKTQPALRVFSVEANPACESALKLARRLLGDRFEFRIVGVGSLAADLQFFVPVRAARMLLEEGTFDRSTLRTAASINRIGLEGRDYHIEEIVVPIVTVDSLNIAPCVIKMDLQGFEFAALKGSVQTIRGSRPYIMVEIGEDWPQIRDFLAGHAYDMAMWDGSKLRKTDKVDGLLNAIFVPNGSMPQSAIPRA